MESRWRQAIFLGIREESSEFLLGTSEGVVKGSTVRRKSEDETRWCSKQLDEIVGTHGNPLRERTIMKSELEHISLKGEVKQLSPGQVDAKPFRREDSELNHFISLMDSHKDAKSALQ